MSTTIHPRPPVLQIQPWVPGLEGEYVNPEALHQLAAHHLVTRTQLAMVLGLKDRRTINRWMYEPNRPRQPQLGRLLAIIDATNKILRENYGWMPNDMQFLRIACERIEGAENEDEMFARLVGAVEELARARAERFDDAVAEAVADAIAEMEEEE